MTDIKTTAEMFETLIGVVESCVIGRGRGATEFECLGYQNSFAEIVAHAHIFLAHMRDDRKLGARMLITQRCLNEIFDRIQKGENNHAATT